ncbi:MAG: hypothetical protein WDM71_00465 [Ferruginibacter sp.]
MKFILYLLAIVLCILILYAFNPSRNDHFDKLRTKYKSTYVLDNNDESMFQIQFNYNNYYIYSTTTENIDGKHTIATRGFLGIVY